jgi:hypothetical protein
VPAPVGRIAASLDEPALLELVEQADELAAVVAERVRDRPLGLARALVEHGQDGVVIRVEAGPLVRRDRALLRCEAEPLEQERGRRDELLRELGKRL